MKAPGLTWELVITSYSIHYTKLYDILTGFHGLHVTLGTLMLLIILLRVLKGHFDSRHHFGFEGVAWYWHFVDVVCRITSYNVCYTKLLRLLCAGPAGNAAPLAGTYPGATEGLHLVHRFRQAQLH